MMELCNGTLQDIIEKKKVENLPEDEILEIITSICRSLEYIHTKGIIHRDLKPQNILFKNIGDQKIWMLTDFGISNKKGSKLVTTVGIKMTFKYASIEQLDEKEAQPYFDVWSLGVITY